MACGSLPDKLPECLISASQARCRMSLKQPNFRRVALAMYNDRDHNCGTWSSNFISGPVWATAEDSNRQHTAEVQPSSCHMHINS